MKKIKKWMNKKGIELDMLGWWIIGIAALVIVITASIIWKGKLQGALDFIKNLFRFRR